MYSSKKISWTIISRVTIVSTFAFLIAIWILLALQPDSSDYGIEFITSAWLNVPTLFCSSALGLITSSIGSWRGEKSRWLESAFWVSSFLFITSIVLSYFTKFT